jgi:nucleotide-binding universal stress UspA family protein
MYKNILVPTDFSPASYQALEVAAELARQHGATLHIMTIVEAALMSTPAPMMGPTGVPTMSLDVLLEEARQQLKTVAQSLPDVLTRTCASLGVTAIEVVTYAHDYDIDLIVMATHGRTGAARFFMGSTTEAVVRQATCPVLTLRPGARLWSTSAAHGEKESVQH